MHYLLVKPRYYSRYPPLGLLKISTYLKQNGHSVEYIQGTNPAKLNPDRIFITSLFTYAWEKVHKTVKYYKKKYPNVEITLGGIYASLLPEHAKKSGADKIHVGLFNEAEDLLPDYSLVPNWDGSIIFSSRGCPNKCAFCAVPKLEPIFYARSSIKDLIYPSHTKVILWDNNFLHSKYKHKILDELINLKLKVDFNQGLDARLITEKIARKLKKLKYRFIRLAYDEISDKEAIIKAINHLTNAGYRSKDLIFYTLYNFNDTPEDFFIRLQDMMKWRVSSYPMRYEPLNARKKNIFVSKNWTEKQLEMIADARRVIGIHGTFVAYEGFVQKILNAKNFEEALKLRPRNREKVSSRPKTVRIDREQFYKNLDRIIVDYIENEVKSHKFVKTIKKDVEKILRDYRFPRKYFYKQYLCDFLKNLEDLGYLKLINKNKAFKKMENWNLNRIIEQRQIINEIFIPA